MSADVIVIRTRPLLSTVNPPFAPYFFIDQLDLMYYDLLFLFLRFFFSSFPPLFFTSSYFSALNFSSPPLLFLVSYVCLSSPYCLPPFAAPSSVSSLSSLHLCLFTYRQYAHLFLWSVLHLGNFLISLFPVHITALLSFQNAPHFLYYFSSIHINLNRSIPAVHREENNLRYSGDDPCLGPHFASGSTSTSSSNNSTATGSSPGNGMISCPDFELPSMVTSDDFWESALRKERLACENLLSTLHAKEVELGGDRNNLRGNLNCDDFNRNDRAVTRSRLNDDETGTGRERNNMKAVTSSPAPSSSSTSSSIHSSSSSSSLGAIDIAKSVEGEVAGKGEREMERESRSFADQEVSKT